MYYFEGKCPHCGSDKGFNAFGVSRMEIFDYASSEFHDAILERWKRIYSDNPLAWYSLGGSCLNCRKPIVAYVLAGSEERKKIHKYINDSELENRRHLIRIERIKIYPEPEPPYSNDSIPPEIREHFIAVQQMFQNNILPRIVLTECRTVLEAAVNDFGKMSGKENLKQKIEKLFDAGLVTIHIKNWAMTIKDFGDGATHTWKERGKTLKR